MTVWHNCLVDVIYYDERSALLRDEGYEIKIDDQEIVVSYQDDEGWVEYRGKNNGDGHFQLIAPERNGKSSLHRFLPDGEILEGYWQEDGHQGMWRITLK